MGAPKASRAPKDDANKAAPGVPCLPVSAPSAPDLVGRGLQTASPHCARRGLWCIHHAKCAPRAANTQSLMWRCCTPVAPCSSSLRRLSFPSAAVLSAAVSHMSCTRAAIPQRFRNGCACALHSGKLCRCRPSRGEEALCHLYLTQSEFQDSVSRFTEVNSPANLSIYP